MSHKENDKYQEELDQAQQEYDDALDSLTLASEELDQAVDWKRNRESWADDCAKKLQAIKNKEF